MQTGLTDAPSSLEIDVCGLSFPAPPTPTLPLSPSSLSFTPFSEPVLPGGGGVLSKFEIKEATKKGSNSEPAMVLLSSNYLYCSCPPQLFLPPSSLFPLHFLHPLCQLLVCVHSFKPLLQHGLAPLSSVPLHFLPLSNSPLLFLSCPSPLSPPPPPLLCSPYALMAPPLKGGNDSGPWHAWQGCSCTLHLQLRKNKLMSACSINACVCVCTAQAF